MMQNIIWYRCDAGFTGESCNTTSHQLPTFFSSDFNDITLQSGLFEVVTLIKISATTKYNHGIICVILLCLDIGIRNKLCLWTSQLGKSYGV